MRRFGAPIFLVYVFVDVALYGVHTYLVYYQPMYIPTIIDDIERRPSPHKHLPEEVPREEPPVPSRGEVVSLMMIQNSLVTFFSLTVL